MIRADDIVFEESIRGYIENRLKPVETKGAHHHHRSSVMVGDLPCEVFTKTDYVNEITWTIENNLRFEVRVKD